RSRESGGACADTSTCGSRPARNRGRRRRPALVRLPSRIRSSPSDGRLTMKVALDLDQLLREGHITQEEHHRLTALSQEASPSLRHNILRAFGVIAAAAGVIAWLHTILAAVGIGIVTGLVGILLKRGRRRDWDLPGTILTLVGAVTAGVGIVGFSKGDVAGYVYAMLIFGAGAYFATSGLLAALTVLALAGVTGAATDYMHACYFLSVQRPTLTVVLFGFLSWGLY